MTAVASTVDARSKVSAPEVVICPEGVTVTGKAECFLPHGGAQQDRGARGPSAGTVCAAVTSARTRKRWGTLATSGEMTRPSPRGKQGREGERGTSRGLPALWDLL